MTTAGVASAPATRFHRTFAVVLAGFCAFLDLYATQPLLPLLGRVFGASAVLVSLTVTAATLGVALAAPVAGGISDRYGRKRTIVVSAFGLGLCTLASALSTNLTTLITWRLLQGVFTPGIFAVAIAYIHDEWEPSESGRATSAYVAGTVIGGFCGRFIAGLIATHTGWQWSFVWLGGLTLVGALTMQRWLPAESHQATHTEVRGLAAVADHMRNRKLTATYAVGFCVLFTLTSTFTYVNFYLAEPPFQLRPASLGLLFFVYLIGAAITPVAGRWIDRFGQRIALSVAIATGVAGVSLTLIRSLPPVVAGLAVTCTGVFIAQAAASSYLGIAADRNRALAVGLYATFYYAGGAAGAAFPGFLWHRGGWPACVLLIACVQILTVTLALSIWNTARVTSEVRF